MAMALSTADGGGCEVLGDRTSTSTATGTTLVAGTALVLGAVLRAVLTFVVLNFAAVAGGHALQHVAVLVEAGDLNRGVLHLVLHIHVGREDDAAHADQVGLDASLKTFFS